MTTKFVSMLKRAWKKAKQIAKKIFTAIKKATKKAVEDAKVLAEAVTIVAKDKPQLAVSAAVAGVYYIYRGARCINHIARVREARRHRERDIYDHSSGKTFRTKRRMTSKEQWEFAARRRIGEHVMDILWDMDLI